MPDHPSYKPATCCGDDCFWHGFYADQPCWGGVVVVDEVEVGDDDYAWIHVCQGHVDAYERGAAYRPPPPRTE